MWFTTPQKHAFKSKTTFKRSVHATVYDIGKTKMAFFISHPLFFKHAKCSFHISILQPVAVNELSTPR